MKILLVNRDKKIGFGTAQLLAHLSELGYKVLLRYNQHRCMHFKLLNNRRSSFRHPQFCELLEIGSQEIPEVAFSLGPYFGCYSNT